MTKKKSHKKGYMALQYLLMLAAALLVFRYDEICYQSILRTPRFHSAVPKISLSIGKMWRLCGIGKKLWKARKDVHWNKSGRTSVWLQICCRIVVPAKKILWEKIEILCEIDISGKVERKCMKRKCFWKK